MQYVGKWSVKIGKYKTAYVVRKKMKPMGKTECKQSMNIEKEYRNCFTRGGSCVLCILIRALSLLRHFFFTRVQKVQTGLFCKSYSVNSINRWLI